MFNFSPKKVCPETLSLANPQPDVKLLWNRIIFCLVEAISTVLPKK